MPFDSTQFDLADAHWETQPWAPGQPACYHLKVKGEPYPFGAIVQTGAPMAPLYECKAFVCDESGSADVFWIGEAQSLEKAQKLVEAAHVDTFEVAA